MKELQFEELRIGMPVKDGGGHRGIVVECDNPHEVRVQGAGVYCLVKDCSEQIESNGGMVTIHYYDPLYRDFDYQEEFND